MLLNWNQAQSCPISDLRAFGVSWEARFLVALIAKREGVGSIPTGPPFDYAEKPVSAGIELGCSTVGVGHLA